MLIDRIHIKNFKGFDDKTFNFKDNFTVIIGNNLKTSKSNNIIVYKSAGCEIVCFN